MLDGERAAVAAAARGLAADRLVEGTSGNLSFRNGDRVAVSPTGARLADLEAGQVAVVDLEGNHLDGPLAPTSEIALHLGAYERFATGAVVHTHAPMATALGCVLDELPCVHYEMLALGGAIRVAPYTTFGTPELAESALDGLDGKAAVLMANHGAITIGADLDAAVRATELLEWAANVYWRAAQIGEPRTLSQDDLDAVLAAVASRGYGATRPAEGEETR